MNSRWRGLEKYIPTFIRVGRVNKYNTEATHYLCNRKGEKLSVLLPENIAKSFSKAINNKYMYNPEVLYRQHLAEVLVQIDFPMEMIPKSLSREVWLISENEYAIYEDVNYSKLKKEVKKNINQYTVFSKVDGKIQEDVWVQFVFHLKTIKQPTLGDLCAAGIDLLSFIGFVDKRLIVSLNDSKIVRDKTSRTEIHIRKLKESDNVK